MFNSAVVLIELAKLIKLHEGPTCEQDLDRRITYAEKSTYFVDSITDTPSKNGPQSPPPFRQGSLAVGASSAHATLPNL